MRDFPEQAISLLLLSFPLIIQSRGGATIIGESARSNRKKRIKCRDRLGIEAGWLYSFQVVFQVTCELSIYFKVIWIMFAIGDNCDLAFCRLDEPT
jgi:hypothetical protein